MSEHETSLSVSEVAALSGVSEKVVRNEIHRGIISSGKGGTQRKHWRFPTNAVAYFMLFSKIPFPKQDRQAVYTLITSGKGRAGKWRRRRAHTLDRDDLLTLNTQRIVSDSNRKLRLYWQGLRRIESRPDILSGEEVFKGTRISVRHIGSLLRKGVKVEDIREDYPRLTPTEIQFAEIYAGIKRPPGRPSKPIKLRRNFLD